MPSSKRPPDQKSWLCEKYKLFKEHCDDRSLSQFFPSFYEEYFGLWPPTPTAAQSVGVDVTVAVAAARGSEETRLYRWMHNRGRSKHGTTGQGSGAGLNLTAGPPKKKAPVQMYVKHFWLTKVKPEVVKLWAPTPETDLFREIDNGEDQVAWEAMTPMEKSIPLWFKMKVGRELYKAESDEVKAEVDRLRDQDREDAVSAQASATTFATDEERMQVMQHFDENFPKMNSALTNLCNNMLRDFGFQATIIVGGPMVRENGRLGCFTFESPGSTHKQLAFSEFCGASYTTDVSNKFTEYLKLCYPKEKRQHYTLGPVLAMADTPSEISSTPAGPSRPPHPPHMTGPDRTRATSGRVARMRTGPLPAHLKEKVFANMAKARTSRVATAHSTPTINIPLVATSQMNASQGWSNGSIFGASPAGLGTSDTTNTLFNTAGSVSNDYTPDGGSHTSILSEDFNIDINNSEPDPWMAVDHFTGEAIIGDHDDPVIPAPTAPQTEVETGILPRLGVHTILETAPPTLLFEDEDVRPDWLISAVRKFLRYIPYYGQLGKVVDLFLTQETRLGYPELSIRLALPAQNRPVEVGQFQKWARDYSCGDNVDAKVFGMAVIKWWLTIQPTTQKQWPPTYDLLPDNFLFDYFNRGGPNAVFLMTLCLGWWANALTADVDLMDYALVVNDMCWVLEQIANHV